MDLQIKDSDGILIVVLSIQVRDVLFVPTLTVNLLSVSPMVNIGCEVKFERDCCQIYQNNKLILTVLHRNNMYILNNISEAPALLSTVDERDINLWHQRMGHLNFTDLQKITESAEGLNY